MGVRSYFSLVFLLFLSNPAFPQIDSLYDISVKKLFQAEFNESIIAINNAIEIAGSRDDLSTYCQMLNHKGYILARMGRYDSAYNIHVSVIEKSIYGGLSSDVEFETKYYLGVLRLFLGEFDEAEDYLSEVIDYFRIDSEINGQILSKTLTNMALIKFQKGQFTLAENLCNESLAYLKSDPTNLNRAPALSLLGVIAQRRNQIEHAESFYMEALKIYRIHARKLNLAGLYLNMAALAQVQMNRSRVLSYMDSALQAAKRPYLGRELISVHDFLFNYHREQSDYQQAIVHQMRKEHIKDSLQSTEMVLKVAQLESNAERKLEELKLTILQEKLSQEQQNNRIQQVLIFIFVIIAIYLLVFIFVYRNLVKEKNKSQDELFIKNKELKDKTQQISKAQQLLIKSEKMALLGRISAGIAHDINTPISAIKGNLDLISGIEDLEISNLQSISSDLNASVVQDIIELVSDASSVDNGLAQPKEVRAAKKIVNSYFTDMNIANKSEVVDHFVDLGIVEDIDRYASVYNHPNNLGILEVASNITNRLNAIKTASTATDRALAILASFKTYSFKRGWKDIKEIDLKDSFELLLKIYQNDLKDVDVVLEQEGDTSIDAIKDELDQVWTNLISNAIYAMQRQGSLFIKLQGSSNAVSVTIEDTGGGIKSTDSHDIFEPFFTTKPEGEGSGLGLDICKQIIKNHYGSIKWDNTSRGAKFTVVLPRKMEKSLLDER